MKRLLAKIKDYFFFSKQELKGIQILLFLTILGVAFRSFQRSPEWISWKPQETTSKQLPAAQQALQSTGKRNNFRLQDLNRSNASNPLFFFDPNTLSSDSLLRLGLTEKEVRNWDNFRNKGGRFFRSEDLFKLFSLPKYKAQKLLPWVRFSVLPSREIAPNTNVPENPKRSYQKHKAVHLDLNSASAQELEQLAGIGPVLANRIQKYREALGGFADLNQLFEVYGLDSQTIQKIIPNLHLNVSHIVQIRINGTDSALLRHPYLKRGIGKKILTFRNQHGPFSSKEQLFQIQSLSKDQVEKMLPYLNFH